MTDQQVKSQSLTGEDLFKMSDGMGVRYELIEGELIEMPPTNSEHGWIEVNAGFHLKLYNQEHKRGTVIGGEPGFYTRGDDRTVRAPDIAFISHERLPKESLGKGFVSIAPELVVEVVSPSNSAEEIEQKVGEWFAFGVLMVWVIYPDTRRIHVFTDATQANILSIGDTIEGGDVLPGFSVPVKALFED